MYRADRGHTAAVSVIIPSAGMVTARLRDALKAGDVAAADHA